MKSILLAVLFFLSGCGTVGYRIAKRTGEDNFRGEVYWNVVELDLDSFWIKKVDSNGKEVKPKLRWP